MTTSAIVQPLPQVSEFLRRRHSSFIDGQSIEQHPGEVVEVLNPADGQPLTEILRANLEQVGQAVESSDRAFRSKVWSGLRPADRERILLRFADVFQAHLEELAQLVTLEQGKSINISRAVEVGASVEFIRYMAGWATKIEGQTLDISIPAPPGSHYNAYTRREPVGVVVGIVPWNFPLMIALWKIVPALAAGCTVIIKPADETPLSALRLAELAVEAGIPPGVFNVVLGRGSLVGPALVEHPLVSKVSFTGSTEVGKQIGVSAMRNMTRFSLELGGKNPMLILPDADMEHVVSGALMAGLLNSGQVCAAASRFYVPKNRSDEFAQTLAAAVADLQIGAGMNPAAQINPVVSQRQQQSVLGHLRRAKEQGAKVLTGGDAPDQPGFYIRPTVLANVEQSMDAARQEIFGPVLSVLAYDDLEQALAMVNDSVYGLAASVWSNDMKAVMGLIPRIEAGTVWVNTHVPLDPSLPFGGYKQSGIGRDFGRGAVEAFTEIKSVCIAY
ncbi:MAG TPA: aldehyde dehydrogenase family protein [Pseudomonas sp.]|uniref:aldehyde dehydrogenase family protein n=1 Tax=Pseudomonas sp. TaxID=306 RepID=UPI002EDA5028